MEAGYTDALGFAIVIPYDGQRTVLWSTFPASIYGGLFIDCVEKAQGSEHQLVIMSTVRCNATGSLGFVSC